VICTHSRHRSNHRFCHKMDRCSGLPLCPLLTCSCRIQHHPCQTIVNRIKCILSACYITTAINVMEFDVTDFALLQNQSHSSGMIRRVSKSLEQSSIQICLLFQAVLTRIGNSERYLQICKYAARLYLQICKTMWTSWSERDKWNRRRTACFG
jgi:hypothetical protein